jgi:hypothetical protein
MRASPVKRAFPGGRSKPATSATPALAAVVVAAVFWGPLAGRARANNGIPGSLSILLPQDNAAKIGLATTFGLILSEDGGASWVWTCEQLATTSMANVYVVGPPPADRFYAQSRVTGFAFSDDESCGWQTAGGALAGLVVSDFFPDTNDPMHVLAAATPATDAGVAAAASVYVSMDGGATFGAAPIFSAPAGAAIVGIEIARSDPQVVYLTTYTSGSAGSDPVLVRSGDGGRTWTSTDLAASLGSSVVRILAVDPANPDLVYLRATGATSEALAVTRDGGGSFATPLTVDNGAVSAFARLASGTVLVGVLVNLPGGGGGTMGAGYRSTDGAMSFQPWTLSPQPHLVGLAERVVGGQSTLYLSGKNYSDGWALATSTDEGMTVTPMMSYDDVSGIKPCVQQICLDTCNYEEMQAIWPPQVCAAGAADGGTPGPPGGSGCHCAAGGEAGSGLAGLLVAASFAAGAVGRRRRRRSPAGRPSC